VHQVPDGTIVVDLVRIWTGSTKIPLPFEGVLSDIKTILESYGINCAVGDQFTGDAIQQHLQKIGIMYEINVFGPQTRAQLFSGLKHLMVQGKIEILDDKALLQQLRNLTEERSQRGQIDVRPSTGKDEQAVALALAANQVMKQRPPDIFSRSS
jgi:phage terminase large subunit-like protein